MKIILYTEKILTNGYHQYWNSAKRKGYSDLRHDRRRGTLRRLELRDLQLYKAKGCPKCNGRGYKGRVGFFELMEVTQDVAAAIQAQVSEEQLRKVAAQAGMYTLREAALQKAREGITSLEEVLKRTVAHEETLPPYLVNPDTEEYKDGDIIIQEGNNDTDFFRLIRGKLSVLRSNKKIAAITEPGEYFGEMAAILEQPHKIGRAHV